MKPPTSPFSTPPNGCCHASMGWRGARFVLLAALGLAGCASFWLSGGLPLLKISPATFGSRIIEQRSAIVWPGEQRVLEMVLDIHGGTMTVIGLTFGARLFSFDYDGEKIVETQPLPSGLSARRIVNDLLLIYAPLDALRVALPADWTVHEEQGGRQVFFDGALNISIHYDEGAKWQGRTVLDNHALHYQLTLDSREAEDDAP